MKYYYIAKRKRRGYSARYAGDGVIEANSVKEAREMIAFAYKVPKSRITIRKRIEK